MPTLHSDMELQPPVASPLTAGTVSEPVYVAVVPGVRATPGSRFVIASGFSAANDAEAAELARLSQTVLQLALINCVIAVTVRLVMLIVALTYGYYAQIATFLLNVVFALLVMQLGVAGVKTRNAQCCRCCCGYLTAFFIIYVILAILEAIAVLVALVEGFVLVALVECLFLALYSYTAEQARQLLDLLAHREHRAATTRDASTTTTVTREPSSSAEPTVAVAEATEVRVLDGGLVVPKVGPTGNHFEDQPPTRAAV